MGPVSSSGEGGGAGGSTDVRLQGGHMASFPASRISHFLREGVPEAVAVRHVHVVQDPLNCTVDLSAINKDLDDRL